MSRETARADQAAWLRDVDADFRRLTEAHKGVIASDDRLTVFVQMSPDEYQAEQYQRFPALENAAPTLNRVIGNSTERRQSRRLSREQIDAEQAEIARVLGR
jgi:hypothetical protein